MSQSIRRLQNFFLILRARNVKHQKVRSTQSEEAQRLLEEWKYASRLYHTSCRAQKPSDGGAEFLVMYPLSGRYKNSLFSMASLILARFLEGPRVLEMYVSSSIVMTIFSHSVSLFVSPSLNEIGQGSARARVRYSFLISDGVRDGSRSQRFSKHLFQTQDSAGRI